jgi:hypothetical protein
VRCILQLLTHSATNASTPQRAPSALVAAKRSAAQLPDGLGIVAAAVHDQRAQQAPLSSVWILVLSLVGCGYAQWRLRLKTGAHQPGCLKGLL